eukprot:TRINITY_DN1573_c0_g1_i7.p1 TRINITY_DN1573_c0_g1~~TRINITY_DN1573_c0_g1_i7.p1  ORF type:complete len:248 (+),score=37.22 TRINITY_DN1573_c0_g1_i7:91-744(+)
MSPTESATASERSKDLIPKSESSSVILRNSRPFTIGESKKMSVTSSETSEITKSPVDPNNNNKQNTTSNISTSTRKPVNICDDEAIASARKEVFTDGVSRAWLLLGYEGSLITVQATGTGNVSEMLPHIQPDEVQYMLVRIPTNVDENASTCRDVMITWTGPKVKIFDRGRKQTHLGEITKRLQPLHASLTATSLERFSEDFIRLKSDPLSGSHVID